MEYITPNTPPRAQINVETQYGNPVHQPTITRPGSTKMIDESVPAAEATVWTILFSWIVDPLNPRNMAIEMTAAGIDVEKVSPALSPKNTFAAVNMRVISTPRISPRTVNSLCCSGIVVIKRTPRRCCYHPSAAGAAGGRDISLAKEATAAAD